MIKESPEQTHTVLSPYPDGKASQVSYAFIGAKEAVIFVHGYRGSPRTTWEQFPDLLNQTAEFRELDCFFWGYDSVYEHTEACADRLYDFLGHVLTSEASSGRPASIPAKDKLPYRRVLVVAHSMGAVISRRALLLGDEAGVPWTKKVRLVLYAPAHHGARLELVDSLLPGLLGRIWGFAQVLSPAINQLRPGSPYLSSLAEDVKEALATSPKPKHLIALRVVHARREIVLLLPEKRFCEDPRSEMIDGTHISICKPTAVNSPEMRELSEALKAWL
jgi:pimeloyl-ACP methyl ester carboxylesterase